MAPWHGGRRLKLSLSGEGWGPVKGRDEWWDLLVGSIVVGNKILDAPAQFNQGTRTHKLLLYTRLCYTVHLSAIQRNLPWRIGTKCKKLPGAARDFSQNANEYPGVWVF